MEVVILAAGKGTRMNSQLPKVMHTIGGKPMLGHVVTAASNLKPDQIHIVVGFGAETIKASCNDAIGSFKLQWATQSDQLGTGHALQQALPNIQLSDHNNVILVLFGDEPTSSSAITITSYWFYLGTYH